MRAARKDRNDPESIKLLPYLLLLLVAAVRRELPGDVWHDSSATVGVPHAAWLLKKGAPSRLL